MPQMAVNFQRHGLSDRADFTFHMLLVALPLACVCAADTPQFKMDFICYSTSEIYREVCAAQEKVFTEDFWGAQWDLVKDFYGKFIYADPSNAKTCLEAAEGYLEQVTVVNDMTGEGNDVFDLNALSGRRAVSFVDFSELGAKHLARSDMAVSLARKQIKTLAKLKAMWDRNLFADRSEFVQALSLAFQRKQTKLLEKFSSNGSEVAVRGRASVQSQGGCHITASGDVYSKLEFLSLIPSVITFHSEIHVPYLGIFFFGGKVNNPEYINADYVLTDDKSTNVAEFKSIKYKDLGLLTLHVYDVVFSETEWSVSYYISGDSGSTATIKVSYDAVGGQLSVLAQSDKDVSVVLRVNSNSGSIDIRGLNLSAQSQIQVSSADLLSGFDIPDIPSFPTPTNPKLSVSFASDWDEKVANTPEIILESSDPSTISVTGQPSKVSIRKTSIADRPTPRGPEKGPNVGLIVGVVIAVIVVIGIIVAVVVVVVVMKKKKEQVHPETTPESNAASKENDEAATASNAGKSEEPKDRQVAQAPPSQPQQPPSQYQQPQQYQYQQQPQQYQYQQPPQQYQYQQPPQQYQYQQPPQQKEKHKHKSKHKK